MSKLQQLKYLIMPFLLGTLLAVAPILINLVLLICFVVFEIFFIKKHGFCWLGAKRVSLFFAIIFAAYFAPFKYLDKSVEPRNFKFFENGYTSSLRAEGINLRFPMIYTDKDLSLTDKSMSLKSFIKDIEEQTGLQHKIYYCGTGANILFGAHPMLGIQFEERTPNKFKNENASVAGTDATKTRRPF